VPIEVPDTRTFAEPPPRRRRAAAKPVEDAKPVEVALPDPDSSPAPALVSEPVSETESPFRKPVRRRRSQVAEIPAAVEAEAPAVVDPVASAFSRPVRRRPKPAAAPAEPAAAEPAPAEPVAVEPAPSAQRVPPDRPAVPPAVVPQPVAPPAVAPPAEERRGTEGTVAHVVVRTDTVVVRLAGTRYAVAMDAVAEVGRPPHVTRVPGVPSWIAGVANWRGRILPVLDLRFLLGAPSPELGVSGRIMVLTRDGMTLAFLAERVEGVVSLEMDALEPVLVTLSRTTASVISGQLTHPDGPIALLDLDMLFGLRSQLPRVRRAG
jgi:purine-binding chemotaxis protein CheW